MGLGLALPRSLCARMGERSMMEILGFIFSSFWIFIGSLFVLVATLNGIAEIVRAWRCEK